MTSFLLIRHGVLNGLGERLAGRAPGLGLSAEGMTQVERLAARLAAVPVGAVYSSPVQRAVETAAVVARALFAPVQVEPALDEVEFGSWTGRTFDELAPEPAWRAFNEHRTISPIAGGPSMLEVQSRVIGWLARTAPAHAGTTVIAVTHADIIRAAIAGCAGISLDLSLRLEIAPASISEIALGDGHLRIGRVNDHAHLEPLP